MGALNHDTIKGSLVKNKVCPVCKAKSVVSRGRTFGNRGKCHFYCTTCGNEWCQGTHRRKLNSPGVQK
jgi:formate dehydrogenase maturation protein FdhE